MEESPNKRPVKRSAEKHSSKTVRITLFCAGTFFLVCGIVGIFMPVLPTTPFLLVATACYARSSDRFYNALLSNRTFGPIIIDWHENKCISRKIKLISISMIVLTLGFSAGFVVKPVYLKAMLVLLGVGVTIFILSFPSERIEGKFK